MFVIFGWEKTFKPVESILSTQCYHCNNESKWNIWRETEWVSLFFVRVFPFINKYHVGCNLCGDATEIQAKIAKQALDPKQRNALLHDEIIGLIEGFTVGQVNYHKSIKANRE